MTTLKYKDFKSLKISKNDFNYIIITSPKALKILDKIVLNTKGNFTKDIRIFSVGFETTYQLKKLSYTNILKANNSSQSLHNLIVINTKKEDYGLWIAAKNRSVEFEKNLLNNRRKIEIIEGYSTHPILELPKSLQKDLIEYDFLNLVIFSSRNVSIAKQILENYNLFNIVKNKATLYVNSENVANKAESIGWINIKIIKKNFTKEFLDNIIKLP
ncbi:uroporphyrinogen-III synthase [bacterium]|nr:uroporphyrinogen-III synthase [bacterium]